MRLERAIKGNIITLRQLEVSDCEQYYIDWLNNEETNRFLESRWQNHTVKSEIKYVKKIIDSNDAYIFAIIYNGEHVGNICIGDIHPVYKFANISYLVGAKNYLGKGIATEAIRLVCNFSFCILNLHRLQAVVYGENIASQKVLLKNGFVKEAVFRKQRFVKADEKYCDYLEYGLLKEEFKKL